jgi:hypothetical protein
VLSIYFRVWTEESGSIATDRPDHGNLINDTDQIVYWASLEQLSKEPITLPVDVQVVNLLVAGGISQ